MEVVYARFPGEGSRRTSIEVRFGVQRVNDVNSFLFDDLPQSKNSPGPAHKVSHPTGLDHPSVSSGVADFPCERTVLKQHHRRHELGVIETPENVQQNDLDPAPLSQR